MSLYDSIVLSDARIPLGQILLILYCFAHRRTYDETRHESKVGFTELSDHTISRWFQIGREASMNYVEDKNEKGKMGDEGYMLLR